MNSCIACDKQSISVPMVTGKYLSLWCIDDLVHARTRSMDRMGDDTHLFIFSIKKHQEWFWEADIRDPLDTMLDVLFEDIAAHLHDADRSLPDLEDVIRVKAKEYENAIAFTMHDPSKIHETITMWLQPEYINGIGGPLGEETQEIYKFLSFKALSPSTSNSFACMILSAKRAELYANHKYSTELTKIETTIWKSHKTRIKQGKANA